MEEVLIRFFCLGSLFTLLVILLMNIGVCFIYLIKIFPEKRVMKEMKLSMALLVVLVAASITLIYDSLNNTLATVYSTVILLSCIGLMAVIAILLFRNFPHFEKRPVIKSLFAAILLIYMIVFGISSFFDNIALDIARISSNMLMILFVYLFYALFFNHLENSGKKVLVASWRKSKVKKREGSKIN